MTLTGFFLIHRGWGDNPVFKDEPFCEKAAWIWLIEEASYEPHRIRYHNEMIEVSRGQIPTSYRRLKDTWKWGNERVRRFLDLLESEKMISRKTGTGFLIITICNYNKYQTLSTKAGTQSGTLAGTDTGTQSGTNRIKGNEFNESINNTLSDFQKIYDAGCIIFIALTTANTSSIHSWLLAECSPEMDCIPEIQRHAGKDITAWGYFTKGIMRAKATRLTPPPEGAPHANTNGKHNQPSIDDRAKSAVLRGLKLAGVDIGH